MGGATRGPGRLTVNEQRETKVSLRYLLSFKTVGCANCAPPAVQSQAGARPLGLAIRPSGFASAWILRISSCVSSKSKTCRLSAMCFGLAERGIAAMLPCCMIQRSAICATVLPLLLCDFAEHRVVEQAAAGERAVGGEDDPPARHASSTFDWSR